MSVNHILIFIIFLAATKAIQELSILGERNSGTKWTARHLTECFNHSLQVREKLVRFKHWFQHNVPDGRKRVWIRLTCQLFHVYILRIYCIVIS